MGHAWKRAYLTNITNVYAGSGEKDDLVSCATGKAINTLDLVVTNYDPDGTANVKIVRSDAENATLSILYQNPVRLAAISQSILTPRWVLEAGDKIRVESDNTNVSVDLSYREEDV